MTTIYSDDDALRPQSEQLYYCIREILQQENGSREQRKALNRLLYLIPKLPGIRKTLDPRIEYQEALNRALENVWSNIHSFPSLYGLDISDVDVIHVQCCFTKWFNKILQRRIFDIYREQGRQPLCFEDTENIGFTLDPLNRLADEELLNKIKNYIHQDPERLLQQCHLKTAPQCNCQELVKRRLLSDNAQKWRDIAQELHLPQGTVTAFWNRQCIPLLRAIALKLGY